MDYIRIVDAEGRLVARIEPTRPGGIFDAKFICRAVNSHDELVDVLDAWSKAHWLAGISAIENSNDPIEHLLFRTRAALAKTKTQ